MRLDPVFRGAASVLTLCLAAPAAMADITADDVWTNMQAYTKAFGGTLTADLQRSDNTLTINDIVTDFTLPMGAGRFSLGISGLALIEAGDGTVTVLYAADPTLTLSGNIQDEGDGSIRMILRPGTYAITASGDPGDITYDSEFKDVSVGLEDFKTSTDPDLSNAETTLDVTFEGWTGTARVTDGDLLTVTGESTIDPYEFSFGLTSPGFSIEQSGESAGMQSTYSFALPGAGSDLMNLGPAFAKGMFFAFTSTSQGTTSRARTVAEGQVLSDQTTSQGDSYAELRLDQTAFRLSGRVSTTELSTQMQGLPFAIAVDVAEATGAISIPVSASPDPQPFSYALSLSSMRLGPGIWAQFDPLKQLPRDPIDLSFETSGEAVLDIDLLDGKSLMAAADTAQVPVHLTAFSVASLNAVALGTIVDGSGAFTFDNSDLVTFEGLPRPQGSGTVKVTGLNALVDLLISMNIMTSDDAMGMRMGLAMFTEATGPDEITSTLSIDETGGVTVNGQRIK